MLLIVVAAVAILFLVGSVLYARFGQTAAQTQTQEAQGKTQVVEGQRDAAGAQAAGLAVQIQSACNAKQLSGPVCQTANAVAANPIPGPIGPRGDTGATGSVGPVGPVGPAGPVGPVGPPGPAGPAGPAGGQGVAGTDGANGANGTNGADGGTGPAGPAGPTGAAGRDGSPAQSTTYTYPDGSTQTCTRSGGTDVDPTYTCSAPVAAPTPP
jgi:hypothetical protein